MTSRIYLDDVNVASFGDRAAWFALVAWVDRRPALAVRTDAIERLGDEPCSRGFPHTPNARQQEGVRDPAPIDRIREGLHHRVLADQLGKGLRPVFACK